MKAQQLQVESHEIQDAVSGVALSLDAFLLNGIQYGVLSRPAFVGFLLKTIDYLARSLDRLEEEAERDSATPAGTAEIVTTLVSRCQQIVDLVIGLGLFRALPLDRVRLAVSEIGPLRAECVQLIQELESRFQAPAPFYTSRPEHSTASVNDFLAGLDQTFVEEWNAARRPR